MRTSFVLLCCLLSLYCVRSASAEVRITGELKKWHRVTLTFDGPSSREHASPNPFRDYRFDVTFRHGQKSFTVPGYFAADGNAAETGAMAGDQWRVHFAPDETGRWDFTVSFRAGKDIAASDEPREGVPVAPHGMTGTFEIAPSDKTGRDHRGKGLLRYVGQHYLQFADTGDYFIKGGADSPENFLAYADFDGGSAAGEFDPKPRPGEAARAGRHRYAPHADDWRPGDPTWHGDKGKGIIGALNYMAGQGMNSVYFLTMNVGGDGKDVWPWTTSDERFRFDCSKLDQWEIVFSHMDRLGIMLHVVTQEQENDQLLDGGRLGVERRLYYRELIARFGHHLALEWNLGEENTNTDAQRKEFCRYIHGLDANHHPIVVHTFPGKYDEVYNPLTGFDSFEGPSLQTNDTHAQTIRWIDRSAADGRKWIVCLDEIGPAHTGVKPDADDPDHDEVRQRHLWGNLMAGGAGCEWYFGYKFADNDLNCEDWRSRQRMWDQTRFALEFFQQHLPFVEMQHADRYTSAPDDYCFAKPGHVYAVYLPTGGSTKLFLPAATYQVQWYSPRRGGALQNGSLKNITGPGWVEIGEPPADVGKDWVALVTLTGPAPKEIPPPTD